MTVKLDSCTFYFKRISTFTRGVQYIERGDNSNPMVWDQAWKWIESRRQGKFHREFMIRCCSLQGTLSLSIKWSHSYRDCRQDLCLYFVV